jgi:hypothetical protein
MSRAKKPYIKFVSKVKGLEQIEECKPKLATKYIPNWFKEIPVFTQPKDPKTVRRCPSFPDFFSSAYVIPMWADTILNSSDSLDRWSYESPNKVAQWTIHGKQQFLDYTKASVFGTEASIVFKAECPWYVFTPEGYSVLQLPMFYHFNKDWSVLPGIIDTDIHHEVNQQVLYHGDDKDVFIPRGAPFVMYLPFKREDYDLVISYVDEKQKEDIDFKALNFSSTETQGGYYRQLQRERDKPKKKKNIFGRISGCPHAG